MHSLITIVAALAFATTAHTAAPDVARTDPSPAATRPLAADTASTRSIYEDFATLAGASYRIRGRAASQGDGTAFDDRDSLPALVALSGIGFDEAARLSTAAVVVPDEAHREDPPDETGDSRAVAMPDPGTVQVFGLGLVILAMVAGSLRREPSIGR